MVQNECTKIYNSIVPPDESYLKIHKSDSLRSGNMYGENPQHPFEQTKMCQHLHSCLK